MKQTERWFSDRLEQHIGMVRWGHFGTPVLVLPTAGGDAEEVERNGLVDACSGLLESGRVKLYSCDSVAGQAMVAKAGSPEYRMWRLNGFHDCVRNEVVPAIHADLGGAPPGVVVTGASIGAFNAVALLCRYPDVFSVAVGMSGTYRVQRFYDYAFSEDLFFSSPTHFLPDLDGPQLDTLRTRFAILACGQGDWEDPSESWHVGELLGSKGVPNRVDAWGPEWPHEWHTWRRMLPQYLDEVC